MYHKFIINSEKNKTDTTYITDLFSFVFILSNRNNNLCVNTFSKKLLHEGLNIKKENPYISAIHYSQQQKKEEKKSLHITLLLNFSLLEITILRER